MSWEEAKNEMLKYLAGGGMLLLLWQINDLRVTLKDILQKVVSHETRISVLENDKE